jgi:hypothetical protein
MAFQELRVVLRERLPSPVVTGLKHTYLGLERAYHRCRRAETACVQTTIYLNTTTCRTFIGLNNFYSWLGADSPAQAHAKIVFFDPQGEILLTIRRPLEFFGSCVIDLRALFEEHGVHAEFGIFTVAVRPNNPWNTAAKKIGKSMAVFYCFYQDDNGSIGLIHPNARVGDVSPVWNWSSLQVISTEGLASVVLYQMHGGNYAHQSTYRLVDLASGEELGARAVEYRPHGSAKIEFRLDALPRIPAELLLKADSLPSSNAKPLLQRVYKNGLFSISHS